MTDEEENGASVEVSNKEEKPEDPSKNSNDEKKKAPGVIYLSSIPTKMNVKLIRDYMSRFGKVGRIYLEPREKRRKNEPRSFKEGWVEFERRKDARLVAEKLNNCLVGGKRRNPWYHELWTIKYLKSFRWTHLNERIAYEQELKKQKLRQDIALAKKEANFYTQNFEKNERRKRLIEKKKEEGGDEATAKEAVADTVDKSTEAKTKRSSNEDILDRSKHRHAVFERKIKVAGNDEFLRQIFS